MHLFGAISEPSIANLGAASWIGSLVESRASLTRSLASAESPETTATSGREPSRSSQNSDPPVSLSRMWAESFGTTTMSLDLPFEDWVTQLRRDYSRRRKSARRIFENGFSFSRWQTIIAGDSYADPLGLRDGQLKLSGQVMPWATPAAEMSTSDVGHWNGIYFTRRDGTKANTALTHQASYWFTPVAVEQSDSGIWSSELRAYVQDGKRRQRHLANQASNWRSPEASDGEGEVMRLIAGADAKLKLRDHAADWQTPMQANRSDQMVNNKGDLLLAGQARNWPTPMAAAEAPNLRSNKKIEEKSLMAEAQATTSAVWSTPMGRDDHGRSLRQRSDLPGESQSFPLSFRQVPTTLTDGHECSHKCRRLHPQFVEWLMGIPIGMTYLVLEPPSSEFSEMLWCHWRRLMRSLLSLIESARS